MNKTDLINAIAQHAGITKQQATSALQALEISVIDTLSKGEEVRLTGFGVFSVKRRAARTGRNPQTGETLQLPAAKIPHFAPGKPLKDALN